MDGACGYAGLMLVRVLAPESLTKSLPRVSGGLQRLGRFRRPPRGLVTGFSPKFGICSKLGSQGSDNEDPRFSVFEFREAPGARGITCLERFWPNLARVGRGWRV